MDIMKENFDKTKKIIEVQNLPKRLFIDGNFKTEFEANGNKYKVMQPEVCFNIDKQVAYQNITIAFQANQTVTDIKLRFGHSKNNLIRLFSEDDKKKRDEITETLLRDALNNFDSFKGEFTSRYPAALYLCTLFVIRDNEDLQEPWTWDSANKKIEDWSKENLSFFDFFVLALSSSTESQQIIQESLADS